MTDTNPTPTAPPQPPPIPPLTRPREGRVIAGVAAGIAQRLGVGTGWVRIAFVVASLFGGAGLLLYVVGWLAIPEAGEEESIAAARVADLEGSRWVGIGLIVLGGLLILSWTDAVRAELVWAGAILLAGVLMYRGDFPAKRAQTAADTRVPPPPPPPPPPPEDEAGPAAAAGEDLDTKGDARAPESTSVAAAQPPETLPPPPPPASRAGPPPRRERSLLGALTLAAILITVGVMALLDNVDVAEPEARHYLGSVVAVAGVGLLIGAWIGKSRGLIAFGIVLLPVLLVASVVRVPFSGKMGEEVVRPSTVESVEPVYRMGAGDLLVDLSRLDDIDRVIGVETTVLAGRLRVIVPADADVRVDGSVGFGELIVFGLTRDGVGRETLTGPPAGSDAYIDLTAEVGFGQLEVIRAPEGGVLRSSVFGIDCFDENRPLCRFSR